LLTPKIQNKTHQTTFRPTVLKSLTWLVNWPSNQTIRLTWNVKKKTGWLTARKWLYTDNHRRFQTTKWSTRALLLNITKYTSNAALTHSLRAHNSVIHGLLGIIIYTSCGWPVSCCISIPKEVWTYFAPKTCYYYMHNKPTAYGRHSDTYMYMT